MNSTGTGVQRLLSVLGIDESEAMACGDAVNDVEMLKLVAKGVAMGISDVFYHIHKPKRKTLLGGMLRQDIFVHFLISSIRVDDVGRIMTYPFVLT